MNTTTTFPGYTDPFAGTLGNASAEEPNFHKLMQAFRKSKRKNKKLKKALQEQRIVAGQCAIAETPKKEQSFLSKVGEAVLKAIPKILTAVATVFAKCFFSRKNKVKCCNAKNDKD